MHNYAQAGGCFYCSNCVKVVSYSILHNYAQADVIALIEPIRDADVDFHWSIKSLCDDILYFVKYFNNVKFLLFVERAMHLPIFWPSGQLL